MTDQNQILLNTKLHRPYLPHNLVVRQRLLEVLNHAIDQQITLVCAPAGFGKTTLVCTWLEHMDIDKPVAAASLPAAWLSLDENDSNLNLFLHYFIAALRIIFKETCQETLALLQAPQQPPDAFLYASLSNELAELPGEVILVLDDYHTVRSTEVHNLFIELARHWPKPLHLVLISRIEPSLPLSSLRAKGMLHEIRTQNLRFTPEETAAYLSQAQLAFQSQDDLHLLEERFEGWPAGLHLAVLSSRSKSGQESVLSALSNKNSNITSYLVDEVLAQQVPLIYSFLLKTSILDRFCASLCETLIREIDHAWNARACLNWIEHAELFLIPLDERREWYRYHHLFQELLQQRLSAELGADRVADLRRQASVWFEEHGLIDEAVHHAVAAGDLDLAARQMNAGLREVINREDWPRLIRWLRQLPEEMIKQRPELLIIKAWILNFLWRLDLQVQAVQQAAELLDSEVDARLSAEDQQILRGQVLMLKAQFAYFGNEIEEAFVLSKEALALLPTSWTFARGAAILYLGLSMHAKGQIHEAEKILFEEYESSSDKTDIYPLIILQTLGYIYLWTGQHEKARQIGQVLIQGATSSGILTMKNWGDYYLGVARYQSNDLEAAGQYFTEILKNRFIAHAAAYRDAVTGLVLIHQIKGESSEALQMMETISRADLEEMGTENSQTSSLRARLMLLQGDIEGAGRWVDTFSGLPPDLSLLWLEEPQVTRVRVLAARGTDADLNLALQILDILDEIADRTHKISFKIELLALRAKVLDAVAQRAVGETSSAKAAADTALEQALDLARPGGFIRLFVDLGKPMQKMLNRLFSQDYSGELINRILAAFQEDDKNLPGSASPAQPSRLPSLANSTLAEPLTRRELEVLTLLRDPLSIKEIALKLGISYATASRHTINIYAKLGANGRWDAVVKADDLNILPSR